MGRDPPTIEGPCKNPKLEKLEEKNPSGIYIYLNITRNKSTYPTVNRGPKPEKTGEKKSSNIEGL